jgi:hypothetical protein
MECRRLGLLGPGLGSLFLNNAVVRRMTPQEFIRKWQASTLSERSACHEHFLDLCKLLGQPTPAESDVR